MGTVIRPKISQKNKYWIEKHRHYELKHFCLQYPIWKKALAGLIDIGVSSTAGEIRGNDISDPTSEIAVKRLRYSDKISLVEEAAKEADSTLSPYILKAVTEGLSYTHLSTQMHIPCSRDTYYDRYRRFFWLLNKSRK